MPNDEKPSKLIDLLDFDEANAEALVEMLTDIQTSESVKVQIINELNESSKNQPFFETMFREEMSLGECPYCNHINHFLIPEDVLTQMGWVTHKKDKRVPRHTNSKICKEYAEACKKKKSSI